MWAPTFQARPSSLQADALAKLEPFVQNATDQWSALPPPSSSSLLNTSVICKPTKPGPDLVLYLAWSAFDGAYTLLLLFFNNVAGIFFSLDFSQSIAAFALKDVEESDASGVVLRQPLNLRPLGLKNSDNKIIAKTTDRLIFLWLPLVYIPTKMGLSGEGTFFTMLSLWIRTVALTASRNSKL